MSVDTNDTAALRHFLNIAKKGRHPGASNGEKAAFRLAKMLNAHLDDFAGIDQTASRGLCYLIKGAANGAYFEVDKLLKELK